MTYPVRVPSSRHSNRQTVWGVFCGVVLLAHSATVSAEPAAQPLSAEFRKVLGTYCLDCHSSDSPEAGLSLQGIAVFADRKGEVWSKVREKIQLGEMPPEDADPIPLAVRQQIIDWLGEQLLASGEIVEDKLNWPSYGNYVDHQALFDEPATLAPATPARLWRLRPAAYAERMGGFGMRQFIQPFSLLPNEPTQDFSSLYHIDESAAEIVLRNAQTLVDLQTQTKVEAGKVVPASSLCKPPLLPLLAPKTPPTEEQLSEAIRYQYKLVLLREPDSGELERGLALFRKSAPELGHVHAAKLMLAVPLMSAEAVFRLELGSGQLDEHGRRRLSQRNIAFAISYALTEKLPNRYNLHQLEKALAEEKLGTKAEVAALVRRLLEEEPLEKTPRVLRFFDEYFDYKKATAVFKEPKGVPHRPDYLIDDTEQLIKHIVQEDRDVLRELLTTNRSYVFRKLRVEAKTGWGVIYGMPPDWKPIGGELMELPAGQRAGILTQPSWLVAHSTNFDNDPIRRGKWIRERLLGGTVPDVPITVDAVVPDLPEKTLRERFSVTRADYCWNCHRKMNPLGMPFEAYDHFGRYRLTELQKPVDSTGAVTGAQDSRLNGDVSDAVELVHRLADSKHTQQVFVRYAFRYFLGRNETLRDARTLQDANRAYEVNGGSFKALVVSLLSSDSFLYRVADLQ